MASPGMTPRSYPHVTDCFFVDADLFGQRPARIHIIGGATDSPLIQPQLVQGKLWADPSCLRARESGPMDEAGVDGQGYVGLVWLG